MLRSVTLGLAISILAAACALVEQPVPPGTFMLQGEVRNKRAQPVELRVRTPAGALPNAVQPASVPAATTADVTFYIPLAEDWTIWVDAEPVITRSDEFSSQLRPGCTLGIEVAADGGFGYGCNLFMVP